ncbi:S41 family peptidase [Oceanispirochaeta crateris]|uniref:S41 family peptidase n=1 Tax=Oceanispirochaeta crateris TaxID=2518645 RepID=A0A5C1QN29_9SPIO|nr:S41 family peptidase [Oceanispirochaeta crateris]QEN09091.1 S41 family peptidase [Oceanispirochaeta crateris]
MKRKTERVLWVSVTLSLLLALSLIILAPTVSAQSSSLSTENYLRLFETAYYLILRNYVDEVPPEQLFQGAMKGLFESLDDPYSLYLNEEELQSLTDTTSGQFGGVGLYISKDIFDETNANGRKPYVEVVSPIEGTPAYRAGIHSGDYIYKINDTSAENLTTDEVSNLLRGPSGTDVTVTILRNNDIIFDVILTRAIIEIPTVKWDYVNDKTGYLRIIQFTPYTTERVEEALKDFRKNNVDSVIVDVRSNPGGLLNSVVDISDFFFDNGTIVSTRSRIPGENEVFKAKLGTLVDDDTELFVIIDNGSASASEILTGVLKDRGRATIVGQTTYGKGSVQQMLMLGNSAIKLTMARYYTPSGVNIDKTGIDPDILVEDSDLKEEDINDYKILLEENRIGSFINKNENPGDREIEEFISSLRKEGIQLDIQFLRIMIRNEMNRRLDNPPIFDLEYDESLKKVMTLIKD